MNRYTYALCLSLIPFWLLASEVQHVLGGLFEILLTFAFITIAINVITLLIYNKNKSKIAGFFLIIVGGFNGFVGFQLISQGFEDIYFFGILFLAAGAFSLFLLLKYQRPDKKEET